MFLDPPDMPLVWNKRTPLTSLVCQSNWSTNLWSVFALPTFTEINIKYSFQLNRKSRVIFLEPPDMPLAWCKRTLLITLVCLRYVGLYNAYFPLAIRWAEENLSKSRNWSVNSKKPRRAIKICLLQKFHYFSLALTLINDFSLLSARGKLHTNENSGKMPGNRSKIARIEKWHLAKSA